MCIHLPVAAREEKELLMAGACGLRSRNRTDSGRALESSGRGRSAVEASGRRHQNIPSFARASTWAVAVRVPGPKDGLQFSSPGVLLCIIITQFSRKGDLIYFKITQEYNRKQLHYLKKKETASEKKTLQNTIT